VSRRDLFIEMERAQKKAMGDVLAMETEYYGLPLLQSDLVRAEGKALRRDLDDGTSSACACFVPDRASSPVMHKAVRNAVFVSFS